MKEMIMKRILSRTFLTAPSKVSGKTQVSIKKNNPFSAPIRTYPTITHPKTAYTDKHIHYNNLELLFREQYNSAAFPNINLPRYDWEVLTKNGILLSLIPKEYGGRNSHIELCDLIEMIAKYNLPVSMYTMIITALFIRNVAKFGSKETQDEVLTDFSKKALIGGFALTEPQAGSNLAKMQTTFEKVEGGYLIQGKKHWQAFSSTANWWLVAAKEKNGDEKKVYHFIIKREEGFKTLEQYEAMGLKAIDYGLNEIDALIPEHRKLNLEHGNLKDTLEMLCASRLSMAAMASGFTFRVFQESESKTKNRPIGNSTLFDLGFVKLKIKKIESNTIITKALFLYLRNTVDFRDYLYKSYFEAQAIKVLATDKMLESALSYQQLCGGEGYRYNSPSNIASYALLDSRVFTIFDGTNDLLCQQLTEFVLKESRGKSSLKEFLESYKHTKNAFKYINFDVSVINFVEKHENKVLTGKIISRLFGVQCLDNMLCEQTSEFTSRKIQNSIESLKSDIQKIMSDIQYAQNISVEFHSEEEVRTRGPSI